MKKYILLFYAMALGLLWGILASAQQPFNDGAIVRYQGVPGMLSGTSASLGGSALLLGVCVSGTVSIPGVTTGMALIVTPVSNPGVIVNYPAYVSAPGVVTINVCALVAGTPTATQYNIRALP